MVTTAYNPEIMRVFGFWAGILTLKLLIMSILTGAQRRRKQISANPEDCSLIGKKVKIAFDDPDVERVRRSHLNDLENVLPWVVITYIYLGTAPCNCIATWLIRAFVLSRVIHTISYLSSVQPWRAIAFFVGYFATVYQALSTIYYYI